MLWRKINLTYVLLPGIELADGFSLCPAIDHRRPCTALVKNQAEVVYVIDRLRSDDDPGDSHLTWMRYGDIFITKHADELVYGAAILGRPGYVLRDTAGKITDIQIFDNHEVEGEFHYKGRLVGSRWLGLVTRPE